MKSVLKIVGLSLLLNVSMHAELNTQECLKKSCSTIINSSQENADLYAYFYAEGFSAANNSASKIGSIEITKKACDLALKLNADGSDFASTFRYSFNVLNSKKSKS